MNTGFAFAMVALLLVTEHLPHSAEAQDLEANCVNADFTAVGRPVMFPARDGISFGISSPRATLNADDAVLIYVWVNNQTDREQKLGSCQMWWDWGIAVYDSQWHEMKTNVGQERERRGERPYQFCPRNIALRISPHSCGPLQDEGNVKVDLREDRDLPAGEYFVTEKRPVSSRNLGRAMKPARGLKIVITDKKAHD